MKHYAYFNEHDEKIAAWLRELMRAGLIMDGVIDTRSIVDVQPEDLVGFTQQHFFAGIAGWSLALRRAGWPEDRPIWTGSCPCQSFSAAGKQKGFSDPRHLWPAWFRLISERRPDEVVGEQVSAAIAHGWLDLVRDDLEGIGYACGSTSLPAGAVAPHQRDRLWFYARPVIGASRSDRRGPVDKQQSGLGLAEPGRQREQHIGLEVGDAPRSDPRAGHQRQRFWFDARHGSDDGAGVAVGRADGNSQRCGLDSSAALPDGQRAALGNDADGCGESRFGDGQAIPESQQCDGRGATRRGRGEFADGSSVRSTMGDDAARGREMAVQHAGSRFAPGAKRQTGIARSAEQHVLSLADGVDHGVNAVGEGLEGHSGHGDGGEESRWLAADAARSVTEASGNSDCCWDYQTWIACRDPRSVDGIVWRPVISRLAVLADGISDRLDNSLSEENCAEEKINAIETETLSREVLPAVQETIGTQTIQESAGEPARFSSAKILQPAVHGEGVHGEAPRENSLRKSSSLCEDSQSRVRAVRQHQHAAPRSSYRPQSDEQCSLEFEDFVRLLPQSYALAELESDYRTMEALSLLFAEIPQRRAVLHTHNEASAAWASLSQEDQKRIYMDACRAGFTISGGWPLMREVRDYDRKLLLQGFGNAIVPAVAELFIRAAMTSSSDV